MMKKLLTVLALSLLTIVEGCAQTGGSRERIMPDQMAAFPGDSLNAFISHNMKYPAEMFEQGVHGKVIVQFVVGTEGIVRDVQVMRSAGWPQLDSEGVRLIRIMPPWIPAKKDGKNVATIYRLPLTFRLD